MSFSLGREFRYCFRWASVRAMPGMYGMPYWGLRPIGLVPMLLWVLGGGSGTATACTGCGVGLGGGFCFFLPWRILSQSEQNHSALVSATISFEILGSWHLWCQHLLQASQNTITLPGGPLPLKQCSQRANCSRPRYTLGLILGCFFMEGLDVLCTSDGLLVVALPEPEDDAVIEIGFWLWRPERVCVEAAGLYSGVDSLDDSVDSSSSSSLVSLGSGSGSGSVLDSVRFLFPENGRICGEGDGVVVAMNSPSAVFVISFERADFRGPRLMPGLPRPRPFPLTTDPSGMTYLFLSLPDFAPGSEGS